MKTSTEKKLCPECGETLIGRSDKKYCSDHCRNHHNNIINSDSSNLMRNVNNALRKNRRILDDLIENEIQRATRMQLNEKGFNFHYFTSTFTTNNGSNYYLCYDLGYKAVDFDCFAIANYQELSEEYSMKKAAV